MTPEQPLKAAVKRRLPIGAEIISGQGVHFRLWAPRRSSLCVALEGGPGCPDPSHPALTSLENEGNGYFSGLVPAAASGTLYRFRCDDDAQPYPDPASRFQPDGPLGPSQVIDPSRFKWTDCDWPGAKLQGQVIYEMHIGTFTREGTWNAALPCLKRLAEIGITLIEVMPVADFGGQFNWGYDGTDLYAPTRVYGTPDDFRRFVDHAHGLGLGVILDVVYNHLGPIGNFLRCFSLDYFTDQYETDWGEAVNFDGKNSGPVREFFITNAGYWIDEFHLDGLRIDATDQIYDTSCEHVLSHVVSHARQCAGGRSILLIGENESQRVKLLRPPPEGYGLDALWSDDFHHTAIVALQGHNEAYYADYLGTAQELISTAKWAYLYQGQFYSWQEKRRGTPTFGF
jgi:maltooligosyltrehalose trehalohydrolase